MAQNRRVSNDLRPAAFLDPKKFQPLNEDQIRAYLTHLPTNILLADREVIKRQEKMDNLKHDLKVMKAKNHLEARNMSDLTSNDDRKAWVDTRQDVNEKEVEIILADGELTQAKIELEFRHNQFVSIRKLAQMYVEQERTLKGAVDYSRSDRG